VARQLQLSRGLFRDKASPEKRITLSVHDAVALVAIAKSCIASSARTPPVILIGAEGHLSGDFRA
jgi:hypothetical protein